MSIEKHLKNSLYYEGGGLKWKAGRNRTEGKPAAKIRPDGYKRIRITYEGKEYEFLEHRAVWLICSGIWPDNYIDHINGIKTDNRICNLRSASASQNGANSKVSSNNSSGWNGVYKQGNIFRAQIHVNRTTHYLGTFTNSREAALAYNYAAESFFGRFSRFNKVF